MHVGLALTGGSFGLGSLKLSDEVEHDRLHSYEYESQDSTRIGFTGIELNLGGFLTEHLHAGFYGAMGGGASNAKTRRSGALTLTPKGLVQLAIGGTVGVSHTTGKWSLRADTVIALRATGLGFESRVGDCIQNTMAWSRDLMVEPRVGIYRWSNPWLSWGLMMGKDLMQDNSVSVTLGFTAHSRPYNASGVVSMPR